VDVNIFAGDQIIVRDSEIHENRDIAGKLFDTFTLSVYIFFLLCIKMDIFYLLQMSCVTRKRVHSIPREGFVEHF
jgi:hypothetical protein